MLRLLAREDQGRSEPRQQYIHAVDVVPTIYELLGIEPPEVLKGYPQSPIEGESFAAALTDADGAGQARRSSTRCSASARSTTTAGWPRTVHPPLSGWGNFDKDEWELYHLETDRAQTKNVAADEPERLESLKDLWFYYAGIYNGLPLDDRTALEQVLAERPHGGTRPRPRTSTSPNCADVPESAGVAINGRSYTIAAGVDVDSADAEGVLYAHGGVAGGHSLYVKDKRLQLRVQLGRHAPADDRVRPRHHARAATSSPPSSSSTGPSTDPDMPGFAGTLTLYIDDEAVGSGDDRHPARLLLPRRRRHLRRARQRLAGHARLRRPRHLRVHRRHDRQGRRRRHRRALRRPRGPGPRLAPDRLTEQLALPALRPGQRAAGPGERATARAGARAGRGR